jgi:hypothetical protein
MDTKNFLKEIRSIIREEIEYALKRQQSESKKKSTNETIQHGLSMYDTAVTQYEKSSKPMKKKKPSSSGKLSSIQDILEETKRSLMESADSDGEFMFTTDSLNSFASQHHQQHGAIPDGIHPDELTPEVANALTRDYSALMAKINEKKGR